MSRPPGFTIVEKRSSSSFCRAHVVEQRRLVEPVARVGLAAEGAGAAAGRVDQHPLGRSFSGDRAPSSASPSGGMALDAHVVHAGAPGAQLQVLQPPLVDVEREQLAPVLHLRRDLQRLAARAGAGVDHLARRARRPACPAAGCPRPAPRSSPRLKAPQRVHVDPRLEDEPEGRQRRRGDASRPPRPQAPISSSRVVLSRLTRARERRPLVHRLGRRLRLGAQLLRQLLRQEVRQRSRLDGEALASSGSLASVARSAAARRARVVAVLGPRSLVDTARDAARPSSTRRDGQAQHVLLAWRSSSLEARTRARASRKSTARCSRNSA